MSDVGDAVRDLHAPTEGGSYLECEGCDMAGYEAEAPEWPCRTAELVYTVDEIDEIVSTYQSWKRWTDEAARRKRLASGWSFGDDMTQHLVRTLTQRSALLDLARKSPALAKQAAEAQLPASEVYKVGGRVHVSLDMIR